MFNPTNADRNLCGITTNVNINQLLKAVHQSIPLGHATVSATFTWYERRRGQTCDIVLSFHNRVLCFRVIGASACSTVSLTLSMHIKRPHGAHDLLELASYLWTLLYSISVSVI